MPARIEEVVPLSQVISQLPPLSRETTFVIHEVHVLYKICLLHEQKVSSENNITAEKQPARQCNDSSASICAK